MWWKHWTQRNSVDQKLWHERFPQCKITWCFIEGDCKAGILLIPVVPAQVPVPEFQFQQSPSEALRTAATRDGRRRCIVDLYFYVCLTKWACNIYNAQFRQPLRHLTPSPLRFRDSTSVTTTMFIISYQPQWQLWVLTIKSSQDFSWAQLSKLLLAWCTCCQADVRLLTAKISSPALHCSSLQHWNTVMLKNCNNVTILLYCNTSI